VSPLAGSGET